MRARATPASGTDNASNVSGRAGRTVARADHKRLLLRFRSEQGVEVAGRGSIELAVLVRCFEQLKVNNGSAIAVVRVAVRRVRILHPFIGGQVPICKARIRFAPAVPALLLPVLLLLLRGLGAVKEMVCVAS